MEVVCLYCALYEGNFILFFPLPFSCFSYFWLSATSIKITIINNTTATTASTKQTLLIKLSGENE